VAARVGQRTDAERKRKEGGARAGARRERAVQASARAPGSGRARPGRRQRTQTWGSRTALGTAGHHGAPAGILSGKFRIDPRSLAPKAAGTAVEVFFLSCRRSASIRFRRNQPGTIGSRDTGFPGYDARNFWFDARRRSIRGLERVASQGGRSGRAGIAHNGQSIAT